MRWRRLPLRWPITTLTPTPTQLLNHLSLRRPPRRPCLPSHPQLPRRALVRHPYPIRPTGPILSDPDELWVRERLIPIVLICAQYLPISGQVPHITSIQRESCLHVGNDDLDSY